MIWEEDYELLVGDDLQRRIHGTLQDHVSAFVWRDWVTPRKVARIGGNSVEMKLGISLTRLQSAAATLTFSVYTGYKWKGVLLDRTFLKPSLCLVIAISRQWIFPTGIRAGEVTKSLEALFKYALPLRVETEAAASYVTYRPGVRIRPLCYACERRGNMARCSGALVAAAHCNKGPWLTIHTLKSSSQIQCACSCEWPGLTTRTLHCLRTLVWFWRKDCQKENSLSSSDLRTCKQVLTSRDPLLYKVGSQQLGCSLSCVHCQTDLSRGARLSSLSDLLTVSLAYGTRWATVSCPCA
jgi:hypothetical protein